MRCKHYYLETRLVKEAKNKADHQNKNVTEKFVPHYFKWEKYSELYVIPTLPVSEYDNILIYEYLLNIQKYFSRLSSVIDMLIKK